MNEFLLNDTPVKVWAKTVDPHAWKEIDNLSRLPFIYHHLAFMPDVHGGMGMPIGGVLATKNVVVPNAVGVDIGCGMCAVKTNLMAEEIPKELIKGSVGAGDAFCAGSLYGIYNGYNAETLLRFASCAAASNLFSENSIDGMLNKIEIEKLEERFGRRSI